jgi:peptidoglycan/xylan/chitin deacetylase (PgdA/CDA1 family)
MLKYQKFNIAFALALTGLAVIDIFTHVPLVTYSGIILAFIGLLAWGSADISSGWYCETYCSGNMEKRSIALTFDDGPEKSVTPSLLDLLREEQIGAAFFCIGKKAEENPELLQQADREGHIIGGHSYSHHYFFDLFSMGKMLEEMQRSEDAISSSIKKKIKLFRPPYGVTNPPLARALARKKYHVIGWSLRSKDTVIKDEEKLLERVKKMVKPGDIILFHDTQKHTVDVLKKFIRFAKAEGYSFERLDNHLGIKAYE